MIQEKPNSNDNEIKLSSGEDAHELQRWRIEKTFEQNTSHILSI